MSFSTFSALRGLNILAVDDTHGWVQDLSVDERSWAVRYLVVRLGHGWRKREVLLPTAAVAEIDWRARGVRTYWRREDFQRASTPDFDQTVSRSMEDEATEFVWNQLETGCGHPHLAGYPLALGGLDAYQLLMQENRYISDLARQESAANLTTLRRLHRPRRTTHLRSAHEIVGYAVDGSDAPAGHLADLIVKAESGRWRIASLVIQCGWIFGTKVLAPPQQVAEIRWADQYIELRWTRSQIRDGLPFDGHLVGGAETPQGCYDLYGRLMRHG